MKSLRKLLGPVTAALLAIPVMFTGASDTNAATARKHTKGPHDAFNADEKFAFNFFLSNGYRPVAAAGIVGNLSQESNRFAPAVVSGQVWGDSGRSRYVAQWNGQRLHNFEKFANGDHSLKRQLKFILEEGRDGSPYEDAGAVAALRHLKTVKSIAAAADIFRDHYERPSAKDRVKRRDQAKRIARQYIDAAVKKGKQK